MTLFQIIMMAAAAFFAYQVYRYIQNMNDETQHAFEAEPREVLPSVDELIAKADEAYRDDQIEIAKERFSEIVQTDDNNAESRNKLAFIYAKEGNVDMARELYLESLEINGKDDMTHNALGKLYLENQELEKAKEHFEAAIDIDDNYELTWCNYGDLLFAMNQKEKAKEMYEKALQIDPEFERAHTGLARIS